MSATDNLFVVKKTTVNPNSPGEPMFSVTLHKTYESLPLAKQAAKVLLKEQGYDTEFFIGYHVKEESSEWKYGDGILVYGEASPGEIIKVEIDTVNNSERLVADSTGEIRPPIYHVLQTVVRYDKDRSGSERYSVVEGTYGDRDQARKKAREVLLDENVRKEDFAEYDEYNEDLEGAFGPDCVVHAVKEGGENILVSVVASA
ncbi:hypothetical protein yc1106_03502 [Curvularia clavata]|uniref:Uncharacterized protein n=1 Tax=Curvularia clavata TaxID=95742 RepID=A0A9Q8Z8I3_CURCL|nr:hypothetical protein yc1106_03502 [Curvularia clavata]